MCRSKGNFPLGKANFAKTSFSKFDARAMSLM